MLLRLWTRLQNRLQQWAHAQHIKDANAAIVAEGLRRSGRWEKP